MDEHQSNGQEIIVQPAENIVEIDGGSMFTTSLIVAQAFEKEHKDVLRAISNLECSEEFNERNFAPVEYKDAKGERRPAYRLTRDGFSFLAMGFTGKKAAAWKEKFLEAFNVMEKALHSPILPIPDVPRGDDETRRKRAVKLLRGFISYWAFVEKIPLSIAEFIIAARFQVRRLEEIPSSEQQSEALCYVYFLMNHPAYEDNVQGTPEQEILLRNMLTACSQFRHTRDWNMEDDFKMMSGVSVEEVSSLSPHSMEKMLSLAGCLLHRVFQRTKDWNYLLDSMNGGKGCEA